MRLLFIKLRAASSTRVSAHNRLTLLYRCVAAAISQCVSAPVESKFLKEHTRFDPASFSRCHSDRVLLDAVATWPSVMVMITASHVWASRTLPSREHDHLCVKVETPLS